MTAQATRKGKPPPLVSEEQVQHYADLVYRDRLGPDSTARVLAEENGDKKIARDCAIYKPVVRSLLTILAKEKSA